MRFALFVSLLTVLPAWAGERDAPAPLSSRFPPPESRGGWQTLLPGQGEPNAAAIARIRKISGIDWNKLTEAWIAPRLPSARARSSSQRNFREKIRNLLENPLDLATLL